MKRKAQVLEYELPIKVKPLKEGGFLATSHKLQGVLAEGGTVSEAVANAIDVAANIIQIRQEEGLTVPLKMVSKGKSFKKGTLRAMIRDMDVSLQEFERL